MEPSPLYALHEAAGASFADVGGASVASSYAGALAGGLAADAVLAVDLSHLGSFELVGEDVRRWTNGMFTNNTRRLQPGQGNRHCACDDRGRVQGVLDLYLVAPSRVRIVLDGMSLEAFLSRYQMYLMLDDIEVEEDEPPQALITLQGAVEPVLAAMGLPLPASDHDHLVADGERAGIRVCRRDRTGRGGVDLLVPAAIAEGIWSGLVEAGVQRGGTADLDVLRVAGGRAAHPVDASDKSMVHELGLNHECCAFDKGCYVGQEVINRIDVRGAIQKRITQVRLDASVAPGAEVQHEGQTVGMLTSTVVFAGEALGLGVLRKAVWADGTEVQVSDGAGGWVRAVVRAG